LSALELSIAGTSGVARAADASNGTRIGRIKGRGILFGSIYVRADAIHASQRRVAGIVVVALATYIARCARLSVFALILVELSAVVGVVGRRFGWSIIRAFGTWFWSVFILFLADALARVTVRLTRGAPGVCGILGTLDITQNATTIACIPLTVGTRRRIIVISAKAFGVGVGLATAGCQRRYHEA
jgi:hypothetical protein